MNMISTIYIVHRLKRNGHAEIIASECTPRIEMSNQGMPEKKTQKLIFDAIQLKVQWTVPYIFRLMARPSTAFVYLSPYKT